MSRWFHTGLSLLLCVALGVMLVAAGMAKAHAAAAGTMTEMTICAEGGETTILIDASGARVEPQACETGHCPDCLRSPLALLDRPLTAGTAASASLLHLRPASAPVVVAGLRTRQARGPPSRKA